MPRPCLLIVLLLLGLFAHADTLRGFGRIDAAPIPGGMQFTCQDADHALVLLHKIGRDMSQSCTVPTTWQTVTLGGQAVPVLVRPGLGSFLPLARGAVVRVFTSAKTDNLAAVFADRAGDVAGARVFDPAFTYPVYLDKFSHYGIGCWYPSYWGDKNSQGKPNTVNDHFTFARDNGLTLQPNNGGLLLRNLLPKLREYNRPYHYAQWQEWSQDLAIMAPEELNQATGGFSSMPSYYGQISDGGYKLMGWNNWMLQQKIRAGKDDPLMVDWLDPNGEVGPFQDDFFFDFSENNRQNFVHYLRDVRGYTLPALGEAWYGNRKRFANWGQVPIPMSYDLYGWAPDSIAADRQWRQHPATPGKALQEGMAAGWHHADYNDAGWVTLPAAGGELIATFWRADKPLWYRGAIDVPAAWLAKKRAAGPVYLNAVTFAQTRGFRNPDRMWLNGQEIAAWSQCPGMPLATQFDVTKVLRPGRNVIAYLPASVDFRGNFFLTSTPWEDYPFRDSPRNARYADWKEYVPWAISDMLEHTFQAIRGSDPDRPIKIHAYLNKDLAIPLGAKYGCFNHNTGDEAFFRPWDKRFGYVRGIPSSAETSGSVDTPEGLKRYIGIHAFTGQNALDYFHNIQSMMYSPAAPVWKEYLPYFKIAPRRDFKKPDIALFWSSRNNEVLPRPVPYCFDLGRGDLQPLGYSYVYVDESTVRDGLLKDYPVIWDTGTIIMDPETVAGLQRYVEAGGTYVLLQETGRHTTRQRDAWPVSSLTGFRVKAIRPMTGSVSILTEQPLFKKLAGRSYYNRGVSIDYSDFNYADKCVALEAVAPGTRAIAHYDDGNIAIGMRTLGKGRVIVLGSPFWRDSYDKAGLWWPGEGQSEFLEDIFAGLGLKPLATADNHKVWREHYLANNGTEEFLYLHNPYDESVTFSTTWTTLSPAGTLYDPKNGAEIPGTIAGNTVTLTKLTLAPRETLIVATQRHRAPDEAVRDWYAKLATWWKPSAPGTVLQRPDLPLYELRLSDRLDAKELTAADAAALPAAPAGLVDGACRSYEYYKDHPDPKRRCVYRATFDTPANWHDDDTVILNLRGATHVIGNICGPVDAWLNGTRVLTQANIGAPGYGNLDGGAKIDVGKLLKRIGPNELIFTTGQYGFMGEVVVKMRPKPLDTLPVTGTWQVQQDADNGLRPAALPGAFTGLYAHTDVTVPAAWKGSRVFAQLDVAGSYNAFAVNEKMIFHPVKWYAPVTYMDITPWVKFGAANRLTLITQGAVAEWKPAEMTVKAVTLQRVAPRGSK